MILKTPILANTLSDLSAILDKTATPEQKAIVTETVNIITNGDQEKRLKRSKFGGTAFLPSKQINIIDKASIVDVTPNISIADVDKALKASMKSNDITPEIAVTLKASFANEPQKLIAVLNSFAGERLEQLRMQTWDELDKAGLLEELRDKDKNSFEMKKAIAFGK